MKAYSSMLVVAVACSGFACGGAVEDSSGDGVSDVAAEMRGGNGGSIWVPDGVFSGTVTATVNPGGDGTFVRMECFQNGRLVGGQFVPVDANGTAILQLGPSVRWTSGDADCTAEAGYFGPSGRWRAIASTTFFVDG